MLIIALALVLYAKHRDQTTELLPLPTTPASATWVQSGCKTEKRIAQAQNPLIRFAAGIRFESGRNSLAGSKLSLCLKGQKK